MVNKVVCVTGAGGFLGSHLVKLLLHEGYRVRGTLENKDSRKYLMEFQGSERLELFDEALLDESFFEDVFNGADGVFHTFSPVHTKNISDPERELITPAKEGTLNVLKACKACKVPKVIITSSITASVYQRGVPHHYEFSEDDWSDPEFLREHKKWYHLSKLEAERAAWKFMENADFDLVCLLPSMMFGPLLWPHLSYSSVILVDYINGKRESISPKSVYFVDVRDVAKAHLLAFENQAAKGRIIINNDRMTWENICKFMSNMLPRAQIPKKIGSGEGDLVEKPWGISNDRMHTFLGLKYHRYEDTFRENIDSLSEFGFIEKRTSQYQQS